jgi:hypothetical protein
MTIYSVRPRLNLKRLNRRIQVAIDATSDDRTANNVMRHEYRILSDEEKLQMKGIKDIGVDFVNFCNDVGRSRELSLAITKMEEAVMWAVKHITR